MINYAHWNLLEFVRAFIHLMRCQTPTTHSWEDIRAMSADCHKWRMTIVCFQWKRCLVASGHLSMLFTFETTMLLFTVLAIWWFVVAPTCYNFNAVWYLVMTILSLHFFMVFVVWIAFFCRHIGDWCQFNHKYVVQDNTTNERVVETQQNAMA